VTLLHIFTSFVLLKFFKLNGTLIIMMIICREYVSFCDVSMMTSRWTALSRQHSVLRITSVDIQRTSHTFTMSYTHRPSQDYCWGSTLLLPEMLMTFFLIITIIIVTAFV